MNLVIDKGNTHTKVGLFENDAIYKTFVFENTDDNSILSIFSEEKIENAIYSSVTNDSCSLIVQLREKVEKFVFLSSITPLPIKNLYCTPKTLGPDRIAVAVAADMLSPLGAPSLVIDAGTAVTYEFVSADSEYMGGNIAPGLSMRFKALNHFTKKLPLVSCRENFEPVGRDTENAILAGVVEGMLFEMEGYIEKYTQQNPNLCVFLTGGDAFFFEKRLKNRIFANENLLLIGLNRILNYNV
ncbi:MAG: type III pantothenate kinase [Bacteroidales bacterium]|nr:type III pantothenate kinase [Bacteroidales bacterium]